MPVISHYDIIGPLGQGGMGEVYVAFDTTLQRKVALKAVRREHRLDDTARARLLREARILSQLDHPNVCRIYDFVSDETNDYLVLELIEGRSLRAALRAGLDRAARMRVAEQVAHALVAAHAANVVHRDLKPENVMLLPNGDAKVLDFGLARAFEEAIDEPRPSTRGAVIGAALDDDAVTALPVNVDSQISTTAVVHTAAGALMGSPMYMSPEQARGEPATIASDMFAFGLLLQELATGTRPYNSKLPVNVTLEARARGEIAPVVDVPRDLGTLIERLKSRTPSARPTAVDTGDWLRRIREAPARRLRYAMAAVVVIGVIAAALKYSIDVTRERTAAVAAREDALRRRGQAEALIGYMLGDLQPKLQRVGRLEMLDDIGKKAMEYFASVPATALTPEEMSRRSQAIYQLGRVQQARGDLKAASIAYEESLKLSTDLAAQDPSNSEWQLALGTSHFYAGDAARLRGDLDGAMQHFVAYRDIAAQLVDKDSTNSTWILELAYGHANISAIHEAKGDLAQAREGLAASLLVRQSLIKIDPKNRGWREAEGTLHNRLGVVLEKLGNAPGALQHFESDVAIRRALASENRDDRVTAERLGVALAWVSKILQDDGRDAQARQLSLERLSINEALIAHDSENAGWQRETALAELRLASLQTAPGNLSDAWRRTLRADSILHGIAQKNPSMTARQRDSGQAQAELGALALAMKNYEAAIGYASTAIDRIVPVIEKTPQDGDARRFLASARLTFAAASAATGNATRAADQRTLAIAALEPLARTVNERRYQFEWARALLANGRFQDAKAVIERLRADGFRRDALDALTLNQR